MNPRHLTAGGLAIAAAIVLRAAHEAEEVKRLALPTIKAIHEETRHPAPRASRELMFDRLTASGQMEDRQRQD